MSRAARIILPDIPHHVVQRGIRRQDVFFEDVDREIYLSLMKKFARLNGVEFIAWCLMSNHVHFIAIPEDKTAFSGCFGEAHRSYAWKLNRKNGWNGHVWQGRFYSCALDNPHLYEAIKYVERNPVRAGIVQNSWEYPWSSAAFHVGARKEDPLIQEISSFGKAASDWKKYLKKADEEKALKTYRRDIFANRPIGDDEYLKELGAQFGQNLFPGKRGRPAKTK
ncbi:MAG: transposase [Planctomycetes bacterium]|nr:transposase [Planctomycetota bacterium]